MYHCYYAGNHYLTVQARNKGKAQVKALNMLRSVLGDKAQDYENHVTVRRVLKGYKR